MHGPYYGPSARRPPPGRGGPANPGLPVAADADPADADPADAYPAGADPAYAAAITPRRASTRGAVSAMPIARPAIAICTITASASADASPK